MQVSPLAAALLFMAAMLVAGHGHAQKARSDHRELGAAGQADGSSAPARQPKVYERPGTLIACTRTGCRPIPPGCWIEIERNWDGLPTGFDAIICQLR